MKLELQFLQNELNRVSDWIRFTDRKSAFLSVYYSAIFTFIFSHIDNIQKSILNFTDISLCLFGILLILIVISFFLGLFFLFNAIFPQLENNYTDTSIFYFGNISKIKYDDYSKQMEKLTESEAKKQISEQIYTNSLITDKKMKNVQKSLKSLFILAVLVFILSLI